MQAGQPAKQISSSSAFPANLAISQLCECKHAAGGNSVTSFKFRLHPPAVLLLSHKPHFPQVCECKLAAGGEARYIFQTPSSSARRSPPVSKTSFFLSLRMQTCNGRESGYIFQTPSSSARRSPPVPKTSFFLSLRMQTCSGRGIPLHLSNSVFIRPPRSIKLPRYCLSCCTRMNI